MHCSWGSTGGWCNGMPDFFQGMPSGVYDNIYEDLDDSPVSWHITEVSLPPNSCNPKTLYYILWHTFRITYVSKIVPRILILF
jgi:hypothetical protein